MVRAITFDHAAVAAVCRAHGVSRLSLFGSATTDRFDASRSDIDLLVEFEPRTSDLFDAYFGLKEDLEALFDRKVDLVMARAVTNPYFAESARASAEELYVA